MLETNENSNKTKPSVYEECIVMRKQKMDVNIESYGQSKYQFI